MKIATLLTALALATGTALAADHTTSTDRDTSTTRHHASATSNDHKGGLLDRTKRALHRMGEKLRSATHRKSSNEAKASNSDTRSMGAAGSESQDSARQRRMDQAYNDWQSSKHKQQR